MGLPDERVLIDQITAGLGSRRNRAGFASDCAVVPFDDVELVTTVDGFADPTHFPEGLPPAMAGHLAARATLSDLASAGADVIGLQAAYGVPPTAERSTVLQLAEAIAASVEAAGGEVLGGDTKPRSELSVTLTALGSCPAGEAMLRTEARPGQNLVLTGPLGGAGAALDRLEEGLDPEEAEPLVPPDRSEAGIVLREAGVRCAMDLSDGLADAATAIAEASQLGVRVDEAAIPLHSWAEGEAGLAHALTTGGDYELLASVDEDRLDAVIDDLAALGLDPLVVGRTEEGEGAMLEREGDTVELGRGYEHGFDATKR